jgi:NTP pyrophosphatase (non-canonical NTP hydrolase)
MVLKDAPPMGGSIYANISQPSRGPIYIKGRGTVLSTLEIQKCGGEKLKMHLEEMKKEIEALVLEKGFYNKREDIPKKLLFAFIELGEASDAWKKGKAEEKIAEELIDVIFYILDASRLACPSVDMDSAFKKKLSKNRSRPYQYGEGHRNK